MWGCMSRLSSAQLENLRVYREYYSKFAEDYEERTKEEAKVIADTMSEWLRLDGLRILDFGVGTASIWKRLQLKGIRGVHVVGLDIAQGMLKMARAKGIPWLRVSEKRVEDSNYTNCFDMVCAHGLLRHCADPTVVVKKAHRALIDTGKFFVQDLSFEDEALRIIRRLTPRIKNCLKPSKRKSSFHLADDELARLIEENGFQRQKHEDSLYTLSFDSFEHIRDFFTEKTMFGLYTYKAIRPEHRHQCDKIFLQTIKEEVDKPQLQRRTFLSLFSKKA